MDQWRSKFSESFSLDRYWSIEFSSLGGGGPKGKALVFVVIDRKFVILVIFVKTPFVCLTKAGFSQP